VSIVVLFTLALVGCRANKPFPLANEYTKF